MRNCPVVLVAFEEFDNLGVRYLASMLLNAGYTSEIIDFREGKENILHRIKKLDPVVTGFSVIFQYHIYEFAEMIKFLRESDIKSHFSAGGQFASLRYEELFNLIPSIDSMVRFEGEYTFTELVRNIQNGEDWKEISGIVYKENGKVVLNPLRKPEMDLDRFPYPVRPPLQDYVLGEKFATLIAGRGCVNNCAFCNNTEYIRKSSLPVKRIRKPEKVVEEMQFLYKKRGCSVFLFEDDDFPVHGNFGSEWIKMFCKELENRKLNGKVIWKINCRPDDIVEKNFRMMKEHGLYLVFLGLDDGTDEGLARLNKHMTTEQSLNGVNILKMLEINFDYGFMLFQPWSTFRSINDNLDFLRTLCDDGSVPVKFLKLMPYIDTVVERNLRKEGRLIEKPGYFDYNFLTVQLDHYYKFVKSSFNEWISYTEGLSAIAEWSNNYLSVFYHFLEISDEVKKIGSEIRSVIAESNQFMLDILKQNLEVYESGLTYSQRETESGSLSDYIKKKHDHFKGLLIEKVDRICLHAEKHKLAELIGL